VESRRLKNSMGIWAFGGLPTRFVYANYHPEYANEGPVERAKRVAAGMHDVLDGLELHYPGEINDDNAEQIRQAITPCDIYAIASGLHTDPKHARGAFTNPDAAIREDAKRLTRGAIDLCAALGAKFIIWPGIEGYNYPFQCDYKQQWTWLLDGIQSAVEHANTKNVTVYLEHKNSEPAMKVLMRSQGMSIYVINSLARRGVDTRNLKVNMDWQHLIMNGENLAEYAELLAMDGLLGHQHANSGWGDFDDDNIVGATRFMETLELARSLRKVGYGDNGERIGYDLYPYTENQIEAARQSITQWEFIDQLAGRIDDATLREAHAQKDALLAYRAVFRAMGMDETLVNLATKRP